MNIVQVAQKTGLAVIRSPFTGMLLASTAGFFASKGVEKSLAKLLGSTVTTVVETQQ